MGLSLVWLVLRRPLLQESPHPRRGLCRAVLRRRHRVQRERGPKSAGVLPV